MDYIAQDSFNEAVKWADNLMKETDRLISQPKSGRILPEFNEENLREIISGNYGIYTELNPMLFTYKLFGMFDKKPLIQVRI